MAGFTGDAALAAMSQRAAQILGGSGHAQMPNGEIHPISPAPQIPSLPTTFRTGYAPQLQGGMNAISPQILAALRINPVPARRYGSSENVPSPMSASPGNGANCAENVPMYCSPSSISPTSAIRNTLICGTAGCV